MADNEGFEDLNAGLGNSGDDSGSESTESDSAPVEEETDSAPVEDTSSAKIAELEATIEILKADCANKDSEIQRWKAKNFDLMVNMPANEESSENQEYDVEENSSAGVDSLFTVKE